MNAKQAAEQAKLARETKAEEDRKAKIAQRAEYIARAIREGHEAIKNAVARGEDYCFSDIFGVTQDPEAIEEIKRPFIKDDYRISYHTGTGRDFAANTTWTTHYLHIEWGKRS